MKLSGCLLLVLWLTAGAACAQGCNEHAGAACLHGFELPGSAGRLQYYSSRQAGEGDGPRAVLVVLHGHPRDAGRSFQAGLQAARAAGRLDDTLVVAPLFQVPQAQAERCRSSGEPSAQAGDALWSCGARCRLD